MCDISNLEHSFSQFMFHLFAASLRQSFQKNHVSNILLLQWIMGKTVVLFVKEL